MAQVSCCVGGAFSCIGAWGGGALRALPLLLCLKLIINYHLADCKPKFDMFSQIGSPPRGIFPLRRLFLCIFPKLFLQFCEVGAKYQEKVAKIGQGKKHFKTSFFAYFGVPCSPPLFLASFGVCRKNKDILSFFLKIKSDLKSLYISKKCE